MPITVRLIFCGKKSHGAGSRLLTTNPRDVAGGWSRVRGGRAGRAIDCVDAGQSRSRTTDPETLRDGRGSEGRRSDGSGWARGWASGSCCSGRCGWPMVASRRGGRSNARRCPARAFREGHEPGCTPKLGLLRPSRRGAVQRHNLLQPTVGRPWVNVLSPATRKTHVRGS